MPKPTLMKSKVVCYAHPEILPDVWYVDQSELTNFLQSAKEQYPERAQFVDTKCVYQGWLGAPLCKRLEKTLRQQIN